MQNDQFAALLAELHGLRSAVSILAVLLALFLAANILRAIVRNTRANTFSAKATFFLETGDYEHLVSLSLSALKKRPNSAIAHWYLGRGYALQGRTTEAIAEFEKTRQLAPSWSESYIDPQIRALSNASNARP